MKLKELLKIVSFFDKVIIWGKDHEIPLYEGSVMDVPWTFADLTIGREGEGDEPIYLCVKDHAINKDIKEPVMVINVIEEE